MGKIINLFSHVVDLKAAKERNKETSQNDNIEGVDAFSEILRKNEKNNERLAEERLNKNRAVLRACCITPKKK
jgi:hypothetical protein